MNSITANSDIFAPEAAFSHLNEIFTQPTAIDNIQNIYDTTLQQAADLLGADWAILYQISEGDEPCLNVCAMYGLPYQTITRDLTLSNDTFFYKQFTAWATGEFWPFPTNLLDVNIPTQGALGIPIQATGTILGWLYIARLDQPFNNFEITISKALVKHLANSLERFYNHRWRICQEINLQIGHLALQQYPLNHLLEQIATLIQSHFDFYLVNLFLIDPNRNWAICRAAAGHTAEDICFRKPKIAINQESMLSWVIQSKQTHPFHLPWSALHFANITVPTVKSELMVCLKLDEQVIGVLDINSTDNCIFRHQSEIVAFQSVADQITQAIHHAQTNHFTTQILSPVSPINTTPLTV